MSFGSVRGLVVHQKHVLLLTGDICHHPAGKGTLLHMPDNLGIGLLAVEFRMDACPGLGKVELVGRSFIPEGRQELSRKRQGAHFRPSSADIKDAVREFLPGDLAGEIVGREPHPGAREILAPVLVGIAIAVLRADDIAPAVPNDLAFKLALHSFGMPEHFEGLGLAEDLIGSETHVESGDLANLEIPRHLTVLAHPFGMVRRVCHLHVSVGSVLGEVTVIRLDAEGDAPVHLYSLPAPETVKLRGVFPPGSGLDHQVGRLLRLSGYLAEDGIVPAQGGIAQEELYEERLGLAGLSIMGGK